MSNAGTLRISLISLTLLMGLSLGACSDSVSVEAPTQSAGVAKSNIKTRPTGPRIEHKLYDTSRPQTDTSDLDDEDEATATLIRTAEKMLRTNDVDSANVIYQRALGIHPESIAALKGVAHVAELRDRPQEALQAYREIIRIDNDNEAAHIGVAKNMMTLGLHDKAIEELEKFRAIRGDTPEILNLMGMAYTRAEDIPAHFDKAIDSFKTSMAIDPDRLTTQNNLGFTYILAGRTTEAIALLEKLVDDPRATVQYRQNLALAYGIAGRESDARKIALQDLPRGAVEKNIATYRKMREKIMGVSAPEHKAAPKKPATKKEAAPAIKKDDMPPPSGQPVPPVSAEPLKP